MTSVTDRMAVIKYRAESRAVLGKDDAMNPFRVHRLEPSTKVDDRQQPADHVEDFPSLTVVILFSVIGLLIAANLMFRFPDAALTVEQFNNLVGP